MVGPAVASRYGTAPLVVGCVAVVALAQLWLGLPVSAAERVSWVDFYSLPGVFLAVCTGRIVSHGSDCVRVTRPDPTRQH